MSNPDATHPTRGLKLADLSAVHSCRRRRGYTQSTELVAVLNVAILIQQTIGQHAGFSQVLDPLFFAEASVIPSVPLIGRGQVDLISNDNSRDGVRLEHAFDWVRGDVDMMIFITRIQAVALQ